MNYEMCMYVCVSMYSYIYTHTHTYFIVHLRRTVKTRCACLGSFKQVYLVSMCPRRCYKIEHMDGVGMSD